MNIKEILNEVLAQSGFIKKSQFFTSGDVDDIQMTAIANRVNEEIRDFYPWNDLRRTHEIPLFSGQTKYVLPSDYTKYIADSGWQSGGTRNIELPVPDGRWYMYKNSAQSGGGVYRCRLAGDTLEVLEPDEGQSILLEYLSKNTVKAQDNSQKDSFTADSDTYLLNDQVLVLGIQAHWAETKMLPQAQRWFANYMQKMNQQIGISTGARTVGGFGKTSREAPYYPLWREA